MGKLLEIHSFWLNALAGLCLSIRFGYNFPGTPGTKIAILSAAISWSALTAGFFATIMATILSGGGGQVLSKLSRAEKTNRLWLLLLFGILSSIAFAALSMALYFDENNKYRLFFHIWFSVFISTLSLFVIIACILYKLLKALYSTPKQGRSPRVHVEAPDSVDDL